MPQGVGDGEQQRTGAREEERQQQRGVRARPSQERAPNNYWVITIGTVALIAVALALIASLINLWPSVEAATTTPAASSVAHTTRTARLLFTLVTVHATPGTALLLLVIILGALGSLIQAATSFGDFVGNRRFYSSWTVWYLLRLIVGVLLALLFYFAVRGGFFSGSSQSSSVNPYGIAALAGLAGLFSKQATDKLREVFETLFRVAKGTGDAQRSDDLANPVPFVSAIDPKEVIAGATNVRLTLHGEHFIDKVSVVKLGGVAYQPEFVNAQQLELALPDAALVEARSLQITVYNPPPGGGESDPPSTLAILISPAPSENRGHP